MKNTRRFICLRFTTALLAGATAVSAMTCNMVGKLDFNNTTITTTLIMLGPAAEFTPPEGPPLRNLPTFCRVVGAIKPASDSNIQFEVWMPVSNWNGKFQGIGNGGFGGSISYQELAAALAHGYAAAATDTGHRGSPMDASWAVSHPEKVADFGYRAIHETAEKAKAIITAFYGRRPKESYFTACSNGGRQALMEAQRFPTDYNGIIAGAPALNFTHLLVLAVADLDALLDDPASYIPPEKVAAISAAVLSACDANDGLKDGIISDPTRCKFDPRVLLCPGRDTDVCLTAPQIRALRQLYRGAYDSKGNKIFPGYSPGGETGSNGWTLWITGPSPGKSLMSVFATQFFRNMVYMDPTWNYKNVNLDDVLRRADEKQARNLNATNPDLQAFRVRGGKLILYQGWSDSAVPPLSTIDYYDNVRAVMGSKEADTFVRLYMVPGMQHCGGGPGPDSFGQSGVPDGDPQHGLAAALERWVETGTAPAQIIASKVEAGKVVETRLLCSYPQIAKYKGAGSTDNASSFTCEDENENAQ